MAELVKRESGEKSPAQAAKKTAGTAKEIVNKKAEPNKKAEEPQKNEGRKVMTPKPAKGSIGYRIGAFVLWALAIVCEVFAIMALFDYFIPPFNKVTFIIIAIVVDMALAIIAAQLWKKANHIKPMSEKNKFLFFLWNNLGVFMACICFIPLIVLLLKNDKLDKKSKTIVSIIAAAALLITGAASYDWHPVSQESQQAAESAFEDTNVYWTRYGHVFHLDPDKCSYIAGRDYFKGNIDEAIAASRTGICSYCARHASDEGWDTPQSVLDWIANKDAADSNKDNNEGGSNETDQEVESTGEVR